MDSENSQPQYNSFYSLFPDNNSSAGIGFPMYPNPILPSPMPECAFQQPSYSPLPQATCVDYSTPFESGSASVS